VKMSSMKMQHEDHLHQICSSAPPQATQSVPKVVPQVAVAHLTQGIPLNE